MESQKITHNSFIDIDEYIPARDTFVVEVLPDETTKKTETGIVLSIQESVVHDRPNFGRIVSVGPDAKRKINEYVYFQKTSGYDLEMIRTPEGIEKYTLLYEDAVIGNYKPKGE